MKILIVGNFPGDRQESMRRFAELLHSGFTARGHTVTTLTPTARIARLAGSYRYGGMPKYLGYLDKFVLFPARLRRQLARVPTDVVHIADHANAVYARATRNVATLATCHDLLQIRAARGEFPEQRLGRFGRVYQSWILKHIGRLPHAACVSEKTREDVLRLTALPAARVSCVPNALNYPYRPLARPAADLQVENVLRENGADPHVVSSKNGGFLLNVGGGHWYKNRSGLLSIYAELGRRLNPCPSLVLVGPALSSSDAAHARKLGVANRVVVLERVSNEALMGLYSSAEGMIFPSLEEGFGWPIAEAQACGCPVFTSNRAPMNEVGGRAAVYFDPHVPATAADAIVDAWSERAERSETGLRETKRWAPELMLTAYEQLYARLAPGSK